MTTAFNVRTALRAADYDPIPVVGKCAVLSNWQTKLNTTVADYSGWDEQFPKATGTSILTERTPTLDGDIKNPLAAEAVENKVREWVEEHGGVLLVRFGNAPKRAFPFRADQPFDKISRKFKDQRGEIHRLEFLARGQQVVVVGVHPETRKPYSWHGDRSLLNVPRHELPLIDGEKAQKLINVCADVLIDQFGFIEITEQKTDGKQRDEDSDWKPVDADAELEAMDPGTVNDVQKRVIPSLLWRGINPNDVVDQIVRATTRIINRMSEKDAQDIGIQEHDRAKFFRVDRAKGNYSPAAKAMWRQFVNVVLPNTDEVGVVVAWDYPGQGAASPEKEEFERTADFVFMQLLSRFTLEGRIVSDKAGKNYAPTLFAEEAEAKAAKLGRAALKNAMLRLFKSNKIKAVDEGSGGKAVHKIVPI